MKWAFKGVAIEVVLCAVEWLGFAVRDKCGDAAGILGNLL